MLKIGFHTGPGGNATGITENYWAKLDAAGRPCFQKGVDDYGACGEVVELIRQSSVPHVVVFRLRSKGGRNFDVPDYDLSPEAAAQKHWNLIYAYLPPEFKYDEFHKQHVWLEVVNEVDKNRSVWLGQFGIAITELAWQHGFKIALFGFASGEPEDHDWEGMLSFLEMAGQYPDSVAIALHEYSYNPDIWDGTEYDGDGNPTNYWKVGRFTRLYSICGKHGIPYPTVLITEWGWNATSVPAVANAMPQIEEVGRLYEKYRSVKMAGLWYLGMGYDDIANQVQPLIKPVGNMATDWTDEDPAPPPDGKHKAIVVKAPQEVTRSEWLSIADYAFYFRHTMAASHDDTRTILLGGNDESFVKVFEPERPSQRETIEMIEAMGYEWEPHYVDGPPVDTFRFEEWPTDYMVITQAFGARPEYYEQFGLPGHEGVDIRAPYGTNLYAVAPGVVSEVVPYDDGHAYGIRVRIRHSHDYETTYAHMQGTLVTQGQVVSAGQLIGLADNTGRSEGSHLHITLKHPDAYEGGSKYIGYPYNIIDPTPYLEGILIPPPAGDKYDIVSYMVVAEDMGVLYEVQTEGGGQQRHQTQVEESVFYHTKDNEWEQLMYDSEFVYRFTDTSPGDGKYYQLRDMLEQPWSKWVARFMVKGQAYRRDPYVTFYNKDGCAEVSNTVEPSLLILEEVHEEMTFFTGITLTNVMQLVWTTLDGAMIERYYYAKNFGLVGWEGPGVRSAVSEIHEPGSRENNVREVIECM